MKDKTFEDLLEIQNLKERFNVKIKNKTAPGNDHINVSLYERNIDENLEVLRKKILSNKYIFTNYKEVLISKGKGKLPRVICTPTVRDKILLSVLNDYLKSKYTNINNTLLHSRINSIKLNLDAFSGFVKIDITRFYSSINQEKLITLLNEKIEDELIVSLISKAIRTPAVPTPYNSKIRKIKPNLVGVPEGLSISNILANIYLIELDNYYNNIKNIFYTRYVDDILILCDQENIDQLKETIENQLSQIGLSINEKQDTGLIEHGFTYLGYSFNKQCISVKKASIDRFEHSIEQIMLDYKHSKEQNKDWFEWKLNLKIVGCICNNQKYGWIFFYSQMTDETLLHYLDWLVQHLLHRFKFDQQKLNIKKFVKAFFEINHNHHNSNYLINFDRFTMDEKIHVISKVYGQNIPKVNIFEVNRLFDSLVFNDLKGLEKDIQFFS